MDRIQAVLYAYAVFCIIDTSVSRADVTCDWTDCDKPCNQGIRTCTRSNGKIWHHHCHVQDCNKIEQCGKADVVFVLDASSSIGEKNFWVLKQFTIDFMKGLWIAPDESRVGCVTYANKAETQWGLTEYTDEATLDEKLWELEWTTGTTNTAEGLQHAWDIIRTQARGEVKHIVVLITDGASNIKPDMTVPAAEAMHQAGIEIFVIGIGDINEAECEGVASDRKDEHFYYIPNYNALVAITNSIINETCTAANKSQCEPWSTWGECAVGDQVEPCGEGDEMRTTTCYFWNYPGEPPVVREANQTRKCHIPCASTIRTTTGTPEPTTTPSPETTTTKAPPTTTKAPPSTTKAPPTSTLAPPTTTAPPDQCDNDVCQDETCGFAPSGENCAAFEKCVRLCECIIGDVERCHNDPLLHFTFNKHYNDISCNRAMGEAVGGVQLAMGAVYMDGSGSIEVGFLKNYFRENPTSSLTVTLWFRSLSSDPGSHEGLFCNADCVDTGSFSLGVSDGVAQGRVNAATQASFDGSKVQARDLASNEWTFVTLVYSGLDTKFYINGNLASEQPITGNIANSQCMLTIGSCDRNFFHGYIDDVRVYRRMLYDFDVQTLFNNGRQ